LDRYTISNSSVSAEIKAEGAELCSLIDAREHQFLWQAGPEWPRHAPVLFPVVGKLKNDVLHWRGKTYPMKQHGFARDLRFTWTPNLPHAWRRSDLAQGRFRGIYAANPVIRPETDVAANFRKMPGEPRPERIVC